MSASPQQNSEIYRCDKAIAPITLISCELDVESKGCWINERKVDTVLKREYAEAQYLCKLNHLCEVTVS